MRVPNLLLIPKLDRIKNGAGKSGSAELILYAVATTNCDEKDLVLGSQPEWPLVRQLFAGGPGVRRARRSRPTIIAIHHSVDFDAVGFGAGKLGGDASGAISFAGANGVTKTSSKS